MRRRTERGKLAGSSILEKSLKTSTPVDDEARSPLVQPTIDVAYVGTKGDRCNTWL
jgi:hypothetical protein